MSEGAKQILVYADWEPFPQPMLMGTLSSLLLRGKEVFSFEYDKNWLNQNAVQLLDPDLQYYAGPQYLRSEKINFGLFLDSSPDRWGRLVLKRREAALARKGSRKEIRLQETDFLLGVYDQHRSRRRTQLEGNCKQL